jgi:Ca-activated chloride channel family protein
MHFQSPLYLILLVLIPALALWYYRLGRKKQGTIQISSTIFTSIAMQRSGLMKKNIVVATYLSIMVLIILGIARPRKVDKIKETSVSVIDMLLVLDISSSMLADDFAPNRLEAVKNTAINFIDNRKEDRIGILVFAGESFIQCPLTIDKTILKSLISEIKVASKDYDGTAIGMAIANGTNRFRSSEVESKVMILLSDGSNNSGEIDPITAAELAKEFGIKIYTIGAGTNQSYTRIPGRGLILNEIDESTLKKIAKVTGGKYFRATDIEALELIYSEINNLERSEIQVKEYTQYQELYGWFLIPALFLGTFIEAIKRFLFRMLD